MFDIVIRGWGLEFGYEVVLHYIPKLNHKRIGIDRTSLFAVCSHVGEHA